MTLYCCSGFENLISLAGERGISAIVREFSPNELAFVLQSRGITFEDEEKLKPYPLDMKINVSATTGLRFCPFCGGWLADLFERNRNHFEDLASSHKRLLTEYVFAGSK